MSALDKHFVNVNVFSKGLVVFSATSPEALLKQIEQLTGQVNIISIYGEGGKHFCWLHTNQKIVMKKPKQGE